MMAQSHLLATLLLALVWVRAGRFTSTHWALALAFGVLMDGDHLLNVPRYFLVHGSAGFDAATWMNWGAEWQGFMHTPWALLLVVPASWYFGSLVPAAAWGLHMFLDFVVARHYIVWGSPAEWAVVAVLALFAGALLALDPLARTSLLDAVDHGKHLMTARRVPVQSPAPPGLDAAEVIQPPRVP